MANITITGKQSLRDIIDILFSGSVVNTYGLDSIEQETDNFYKNLITHGITAYPFPEVRRIVNTVTAQYLNWKYNLGHDIPDTSGSFNVVTVLGISGSGSGSYVDIQQYLDDNGYLPWPIITGSLIDSGGFETSQSLSASGFMPFMELTASLSTSGYMTYNEVTRSLNHSGYLTYNETTSSLRSDGFMPFPAITTSLNQYGFLPYPLLTASLSNDNYVSRSAASSGFISLDEVRGNIFTSSFTDPISSSFFINRHVNVGTIESLATLFEDNPILLAYFVFIGVVSSGADKSTAIVDPGTFFGITTGRPFDLSMYGGEGSGLGSLDITTVYRKNNEGVMEASEVINIMTGETIPFVKYDSSPYLFRETTSSPWQLITP